VLDVGGVRGGEIAIVVQSVSPTAPIAAPKMLPVAFAESAASAASAASAGRAKRHSTPDA
jgi:hypothetical protein